MNHGVHSFKVGSVVNFKFMFPDKVKRLIFRLFRSTEPNNLLVEQVIENPSMQNGIAEVDLTSEATTLFGDGLYNWKIFALANDGSRDTLLPFSEGQVILRGENVDKENNHNILPTI